jgi:hypothetical protein
VAAPLEEFRSTSSSSVSPITEIRVFRSPKFAFRGSGVRLSPPPRESLGWIGGVGQGLDQRLVLA